MILNGSWEVDLAGDTWDAVVIGGGQAGLASSYSLSKGGCEHLVLEQASQPAEAWRNHRWDSFTLVTPNWMIQTPGAAYEGNDPDGFLPWDMIVSYLEEYVCRFDLPVKFGMRATCIQPDGDGYRVTTNDGDLRARNIVVATGSFQAPKLPSFARELPEQVDQLGADSYGDSQALKPGAVLVVCSGQSGCHIAEELYLSGRKVYLSIVRGGRVPRRCRGQDITSWLVEIGFFDRAAQLPSPKARFDANPQVSGTRGGHSLNLHQFARDCVTLLGHLLSAHEGKVSLAADLSESLARMDAADADVLKRIDGFIENAGLHVAPESIRILGEGYAVEPIEKLDLIDAGVGTVIWAMGFRFDYGLVKISIFDEFGYPRRSAARPIAPVCISSG